MHCALWLSTLALAVSGSVATGQGPQGLGSTAEEFEAKLAYQEGTVSLSSGLATLNLPSGYRFLDGAQAQRVLVKGWGNPPEAVAKVLGMIVPANIRPLNKSAWGVVITYEPDGYVRDDGAERINYDTLLAQMQAEAKLADSARIANGYPIMRLIGWAAPPHYDRATHKLYWAKEIQWGDDAEHGLNYNVRVLGRRGVLVLNAVAGMSQLADVERDMQTVLGAVEFNQGHRYADFLEGKDKVAEYGIAGLIVGAVAAKTGVFKLLLLGLLAMKKMLVVAAVAVAAWVKSIFAKFRRNKTSDAITTK